jgi:hypothetical protein
LKRERFKAEQDTFYKRDVTANRVKLLEQCLQSSRANQKLALQQESSQLTRIIHRVSKSRNS